MGLQLLGGLTPARFQSQYWQKKPLLVRLDHRTPLLFDDTRMYVNGEAIASPVPQRATQRPFADRRTLAPDAKLPRALCSVLHRWYLHGWLLIGERHG